jgi:hypothetical protein
MLYSYPIILSMETPKSVSSNTALDSYEISYFSSILNKRAFRISKFALVLLFFGMVLSSYAQTTFTSGSYIINMGITPQTANNGLKPYGLIYDLIKNNNVPIYWVISPTKVKDGADFTYNGVQYKGGTFIIPAESRSAAVNSKITSYAVSGVTTTSALTVNITRTLTAVPRWTLDAQNGAIAQGFFSLAGIPATSYNWKDPQLLGGCDDIFVMPHADPTWATHSNLYNWNRTQYGAIWAGCHAVSVLENMNNGSLQTNFLATNVGAVGNALVPFGSHADATPPYTHQNPTEAGSQYMGITDAAHLNGSEQVYLPKLGGGWRPTTKILAYDQTQANVPGLSPGQAAIIATGRGFGLNNAGWVMYESGHDIKKDGGTATIAAVRAFFNFSFEAVTDKVPFISTANLPTNLSSGSTTALSVTVSSPVGSALSYQWISTCGGTFSSPTSSSTNFTAPTVTGSMPCIIHCIITDACGRRTFVCQSLTISAGPTIVTESGTVSTVTGGVAVANVRSNDFVSGTTPATAANSTISQVGTWQAGITLNTTTGAISVAIGTTPGTYPVTYQLCDLATPTPQCKTVVDNITVTPLIQPVTESGTVASATGGTAIPNIRTNDMVNGSPATTVNSTIAQSGIWPTGITLNTTTGAIDVVPGTTPGIYNVTYQLCDKLTPQNCATMVDIVKVTGDIKPVTENGTVTSITGGTAIANIRTNDLINGAGATSANSTIATSGSWPSGISLNTSTGAISVVPGTTPGIYPVTYRLCDLATLPNCETMEDTIFVTGGVILTPDKTNINAVCGTQITATLNVLTNDSNPGGSALSLTAVNSPANGIMTFNPNGTINYTPNEGFTGLEILTYTACDNSANCANSIFAISVGAGSFPATVNDVATIAEDNIATINVLTNDGSGLTLVGVPGLPKNGKISVNTNGTITYIPNADFAGTDTFCYSVKNASGVYGLATVTVTVTNDNCDAGTMSN